MKKYILIMLTGLFLMLSGCEKNIIPEVDDQKSTQDNPISEEDLQEDSQASSDSEEVTSGIYLFERGERYIEGASADVLAMQSGHAMYKGKYISQVSLLAKCPKGYIVSYALSEEPVEFADGEIDIEIDLHLGLYDANQGDWIEDISFGCENLSYFEKKGDIICKWKNGENQLHGMCYNLDLKQVAAFDIEGTDYGILNEDGSICYYLKDSKAYACDVKDGSTRRVELQRNLKLESLMQIVTYRDVDYLICNVVAGDLQSYQCMINGQDGSLVYLQPDSVTSYNHVSDYQVFQTYYMDEEGNNHWVFAGDDFTSVEYHWTGEEYVNSTIVGDGIVALYFDKEDGTSIALYRLNTGERLGSTVIPYSIFTGDEIEIENTKVEEEPWYYMLSNPLLLDDTHLLMAFGDYTGSNRWVEWNISDDSGDWSAMEIMDAKDSGEWIASYDDLYDPNSFVPGELTDDFTEARQYADTLEEKYGIEILIGVQCSGIEGGYAISALKDSAVTMEALHILDEELARYPSDFIQQLTFSWYEGLIFDMASELIGVQGENLDYAGGFQSTLGSKFLLVMDCRYPEDIRRTIHHEMSHVIDIKIDEQDDVRDDNYWMSLNPVIEGHEDCYTYDYSMWGYEDTYPYTYDQTFYGGDSDTVYFIDCYSMICPTEDRARLFEYAMDQTGYVKWDECPHLREKLNYYCKNIRSAFDSDSWEILPWEK